MKPRLLIFILLALFMGASVAHAQNTSRWYEAEVPVSDQTDAQRQEAVATALGQVLVKVSGRGDVASDAALTRAMDRPTHYLQTFRYRPNENPAQAERWPLILWVKFDSRGVEQLLRGARIPVWGGVRPNTLVWLGVEQGGKRQLVGNNDAGLAREILVSQAATRALPISLPLLDLQDNQQVAIADVWGDFHERVLAASRRYETQAVLIGKLYPLTSGGWKSRWTLYTDNTQLKWEAQGREAREALTVGIDGSADRMAGRYAANYAGGGGEALLVIRSVNSLTDYHRVVDYLLALHGIATVSPVTIKAGEVQLRVRSDGALTQLRKTIGLGEVLKPEAALPVVSGHSPLDEQGMPVDMPVDAAEIMAFRLLP